MDRTQLCNNFDELIKCTACNDTLSGHIILCESGHNICAACTMKVFPCKLCKKSYTAIRNSLAETVVSQKNSIKELIMGTGRFSQDVTDDLAKVNKPEFKKDFTCWIDRSCTFKGSVPDIIEHLKKSHPLEFEENDSVKLPHSITWQIAYPGANSYVNRTIKIPDGLFLLHIFINNEKELAACALMYAYSSAAFKYSYKIAIACDGNTISVNGRVNCARVHKNFLVMSKQGLFIDRNQAVYKAILEKSRFECTLDIFKNELPTTDESDVNDVKQKRRVYNNSGQKKSQKPKGPSNKDMDKKNDQPAVMTNKFSSSNPQLNKITKNSNYQNNSSTPPLLSQHSVVSNYPLYPQLPQEHLQVHPPPMAYNPSHFNHSGLDRPAVASGNNAWMNPDVRYQYQNCPPVQTPSAPPLQVTSRPQKNNSQKKGNRKTDDDKNCVLM